MRAIIVSSASTHLSTRISSLHASLDERHVVEERETLEEAGVVPQQDDVTDAVPERELDLAREVDARPQRRA